MDDKKELVETLSGLIGLINLIESREDVSPAFRASITTNHRYIEAQEVLRKHSSRNASPDGIPHKAIAMIFG